MARSCQHSLKALDQDLAKAVRRAVNKPLDEIITSDEELNRLFNLITSVEGIGAVRAREVLITTARPPGNEFKDFTEAKKYAARRTVCYAGVVAFQHQ